MGTTTETFERYEAEYLVAIDIRGKLQNQSIEEYTQYVRSIFKQEEQIYIIVGVVEACGDRVGDIDTLIKSLEIIFKRYEKPFIVLMNKFDEVKVLQKEEQFAKRKNDLETKCDQVYQKFTCQVQRHPLDVHSVFPVSAIPMQILGSHLFADDLTIIMNGALEKGLFDNTKCLQSQAKVVLSELEHFSENYLLPVNVTKTKAMIVHNAVNVPKPVIEYKGIQIEYVTNFKCLGVHIGTKLGWGEFIDDRIQKVKKSYCGLKKIFYSIPKSEIKIRRKLFLAFSLPQFIWLFFCFFYFTERQKEKIEHVFGTGLRLVYSLWGYDDISTLALSRELTLRDYLYKYWLKFQKHLDTSPEAEAYRQTISAYFIAKTPFQTYFDSTSFKSNGYFPTKLAERAKHTYLDVISFIDVHKDHMVISKSQAQS